MRGGVKFAELVGPALWAGQRWQRLVEQAAIGSRLTEGFEYAKLGQTKRLLFGPGKIDASIQGRADRPYTTAIVMSTIPETAWEGIVAAMSEEALYAAKLLANELPSNIEDVFRPRGLKLFPDDASELTVSCTCADHLAAKAEALTPAAPPSPDQPPGDPVWCKHVCCLMQLTASRLAAEPFLVFALRGLDGRELIERLRERRAVAGAPPGDRVPVYVQHVPGVTDQPGPPLDQCLSNFWDARPGLSDLDIPIEPPVVTHPLLRRLGPSPFQAQFPLVGLLASCYETISAAAVRKGEA